jgi:hypothetical protein
MTAAPSRCWNHPLPFAIQQTICTHISVVPSTTMCRSNKVRKYFYEKNHSPLLVFASTLRRPRSTTDFTVHLPPSPHPIPRASSIDRRRGAEAIWGWDIALFTCFACCFYLTLTNLIHLFVAPPITPPTPTSIPSTMPVPSWRSNIYPRRRGAVKKGEIWHETSSFANFWILYSSALVKQNNKTLHNNQTPRNNQPSNQLLYKGSAKEKGKQWTSGKLLTLQYLTHLQHLASNKHTTTQHPNTTQQSATSWIKNC